MSTEADARALLRVAPENYVAERTRLVKEARADRDRSAANFYQSLKRPNLSVWAVLAAGDDAEAVKSVVAATKELAKVQAGGSSASALGQATKERKKALEALVDRAVTALREWDAGAEARRPEIRSMIDQLSRHPELVDTWLDATLRELPDDAFGFATFDEMEVTTPPASDKPVKRAKPATSKSQTRVEPAPRAPRVADTKKARQDVATSSREVALAERRVDSARTELRKAESELRRSEDELAGAQKRLDKATERLESLRSH